MSRQAMIMCTIFFADSSPRLEKPHSSSRIFRKSYERSDDRRSSPLIAVYGSNAESPRLPRLSMVSKEGEGQERGSLTPPPRTSTPEIKVTPTPPRVEPSSSIENVDVEQNCFGAAKEAREVTPMVPVGVSSIEDFISPEAQKLTGEILKESQLEDLHSNTDNNVVYADGNVLCSGSYVADEDSNVAYVDGYVDDVDGNVAYADGNVTSADNNAASADGNAASADGNVAYADSYVANVDSKIAYVDSNAASVDSNVAQVDCSVKDEGGSDVPEGTPEGTPSEHAPSGIPEENTVEGKEITAEEKQQEAADMNSDAIAASGEQQGETVNATPVTDSSGVEVPPEETNMASRSSTIFVDMSNLSFQDGNADA